MIAEILFKGSKKAIPGKEICYRLNISQRELTAQIERERRRGEPICAATDRAAPGYYLADSKQEMERYCSSLKHREREIAKTRRACSRSIGKLPSKEAATSE